MNEKKGYDALADVTDICWGCDTKTKVMAGLGLCSNCQKDY